MTTKTLDLMAGERARLIRERPDAPRSVVDVTDPRWGSPAPVTPKDAGALDPTDPRCSQKG
jgi:hypothetical protein